MAGGAGLGAVGAHAAGPAGGELAGPAVTPGRPAGARHPGTRRVPTDRGGIGRGHGRGGAGQPPAPASGGLAAARDWAIAPVLQPGHRLRALRSDGPARRAAGGHLPDRVLQQRHHRHGRLRWLRGPAHPQRVAARPAVALVGQSRGRRHGRAGGVGGADPPTHWNPRIRPSRAPCPPHRPCPTCWPSPASSAW
jgi:hypothetical protein